MCAETVERLMIVNSRGTVLRLSGTWHDGSEKDVKQRIKAAWQDWIKL